MSISSIRLVVQAKNLRYAGSDRTLRVLNLDYLSGDDEFSNGRHLRIRLRICGSDMCIKDSVDRAISFDTLAWVEDTDWTHMASWTQGTTTWTLHLT